MPGTPATTPNFGIPRYDNTDDADFAPQVNAISDRVDSMVKAAIDAATTAAVAAATPAGSVIATARSEAPTGWLLCDGAAVSRTTYAALFAAIGTAYGAGNGFSTFNLPDLRGRVPVGVDGSANRQDANDALGSAGGAQKHTLTALELPAAAPRAASGLGGVLQTGVNASGGSGTSHVVPYFPTATDLWTTGGDQPHNNMPPFQVLNFVIKQ
ncbi:tail fiber protein [Solirubrobacter phytolaccae]|uniref:Tail fiber protein n=1 Tax=Solirubrobacter phytolaccae TaxID=1404360 RepID=A0A9X3N5V0_9ACTN|nr:tail fiber protein [Solirubrobacter phytolaccae]MDA0179025.1 tail fiber protein [Solirubrobacter phytolaccae]